MKKMMAIITLLTGVYAQANTEADVFSEYQRVGEEAMSLALEAQPNNNAVVAKLQELVGFGYRIMDLYLVKYPECTEQFNQLKSVDSQILTLSYTEIDELYHDGKGLVEAPRVCYKGRSLVVHPYQVAALALANELQNNVEVVEHELDEVIVRSGKMKTDLGL